MPADDDQDNGNRSDDGGQVERMLKEVHILVTGHMIGTDTQDKKGCRGQTGCQGMFEHNPGLWIEYQRPEVDHFRPAIIEHVPDWMLHKGICDQDPQSRQGTTQRHQPDDRGVQLFGKLVPTENP